MGKIWIYTKVVFFAILLIYVLFFCANNTAQKFELWLWYNISWPTTALKLAVCAFLAGVIAAIFIRTTWVTLRQLREMKDRKRTERLHRDVEDMKMKAAMLQPKAPDEKIAET